MLTKLNRRLIPGSAVLGLALLFLTACSQLDPYAAKFPQLAIGDDRTRVIGVMGQPDSVNSVEVPLLTAEQLVWRAPGRGRVYVVTVIMDRAVAKLSVD